MNSTASALGTSFWIAGSPIEMRPPLTESISVDVCIIGAGIAGLTTAYLLAKERVSVAVLEDGLIGNGMSGFTTAHLTNALDDRYIELEKYHGKDGAALAAASHSAAIDCVADIASSENIDCDFRRLDGYLFAPPGDDSDDLEKEFECAIRAGLAVRDGANAPINGFSTGRSGLMPKPSYVGPICRTIGMSTAKWIDAPQDRSEARLPDYYFPE